MGYKWLRIGYKTKKAHRSEPLLLWNTTIFWLRRLDLN
jgi:hypothetical protein